jgi:FixJ family two-component response regulator
MHRVSRDFWMRLMSKPQNIIAVVDDDPQVCESLKTLLSSYGYDAETFTSAETFLARASTCRAFCLIVDFHLGDITGVELARQLAADGFKFPIIFMTGHRDVSIERQAFDVGGLAFLYKPFPATTLIDAIKKAAG